MTKKFHSMPAASTILKSLFMRTVLVLGHWELKSYVLISNQSTKWEFHFESKNVSLTFSSFTRNRINKMGSQKDEEQKKSGNYFFYDDGEDDEVEEDEEFEDI